MTLAPRKKLGAEHLRLLSPFSRAVFDRQKVDPSVFPCKFRASLWSPPLLFKQKLQSLIKPPVKYRQMQLVSLKPLTRHSGAQGVGWTAAGSAGQQNREGAGDIADPHHRCKQSVLRATVQP